MVKHITAVAVTLLLCSCTGSPTSDKAPAAQIMSTFEDPHPLPVHVIVLTDATGGGNPLWTRGYVDELLDTASALVGHAGTFQLTNYTRLAEPHLYAGLQSEVLPLARAERQPGVLTIVISRPDTEDYAGLTDQASRPGRPDPYLVMRSRHTDWSGINATSAILLHELGHNMGLYHKPEPFLDSGAPHTDDWYMRDDGIQGLSAYLSTKLRR